ncbi:MAG: dihydrofolate reductase [Bacteroidota bacterium]|jgi:dihydrofolate reductase
MLISMIAAVGENLELGASNELLWHLPDDFAWFIKHTKGKPVIMGRKTMESLGKPLKGRTNIVLTSRDEVLPGFQRAENWEQALSQATQAIELKRINQTVSDNLTTVSNADEIMIIGGGEIYKQALGFSNRLYITQVKSNFDSADTYFPKWQADLWSLDYCESHGIDETHKYAFDLCVLNRKSHLG